MPARSSRGSSFSGRSSSADPFADLRFPPYSRRPHAAETLPLSGARRVALRASCDTRGRRRLLRDCRTPAGRGKLPADREEPMSRGRLMAGLAAILAAAFDARGAETCTSAPGTSVWTTLCAAAWTGCQCSPDDAFAVVAGTTLIIPADPDARTSDADVRLTTGSLSIRAGGS